jgi:hypothetical protein
MGDLIIFILAVLFVSGILMRCANNAHNNNINKTNSPEILASPEFVETISSSKKLFKITRNNGEQIYFIENFQCTNQSPSKANQECSCGH